MPWKSPQIALLLVVAACGNDRPAAAPPAAPERIALTDAEGELVLQLSVTPEQCTVTGAAEIEVTRKGNDTIATMGKTTTLTLGPGVTGAEISDADGTTRMRVLDEAGQLALVSKDGVPVARVFANVDDASVVDAARAPVLRVTRAADQVTVSAPEDGTATGAVTGTSDLTLAAILATPGVPPDVRALIACARALPAPAPASGSDSP